MQNDYFLQLLAKPDAIVKDAEGFKTVISMKQLTQKLLQCLCPRLMQLIC